VLDLPGPAVGLPHPRDVRAGGRGARGSIDLRGVYTGRADIDDFGDADVTLEITRQRRGRISGTLWSPLLDEGVSGTVPVTFGGNRRFSVRFAEDGTFVEVSGRANRDGSVTGVIEGTVEGRGFSGTFSLERIGAPGSRVAFFD
jgi:hypothetical protein